MGDCTARSGKEQDDPEHHAVLQSKEVPKGQKDTGGSLKQFLLNKSVTI